MTKERHRLAALSQPALGLFTRREWAIVAIVIVLTIGTTGIVAVDLLRSVKQQRFNSESEAVLNNIGQHITEIRGVLKSMLGTHYASDEFAGMDMSAFAEQLQNYSPFVRKIGIFGTVDASLREDFEQYGAQYRDNNFNIHTINRDGAKIRHQSDHTYYPVISANPIDSDGIKMLGLDLASRQELHQMIQASATTGRVVIASIPEHWQLQGSAILLQPIYFTEQPPGSEQERMETYAGGIWVTIDPMQLFSDISNRDGSMFAVNSSIRGQHQFALFNSADDGVRQTQGTAIGNGQVTRTWHFGDAQLDAVVKRTFIASYRELQILLAGCFVACLLALAITGILYQRRAVEKERLRSLSAINLEKRKAEHTLESISDPVISVDNELIINFANPAAQSFFKTRNSQLQGSALEHTITLMHGAVTTPEMLSWSKLALDTSTADLKRLDVSVPESIKPDATLQLTFSSMMKTESEDAGYLLVFQDVSTERELTAELEHQAHHDPLTGVYNRNYFERKLDSLLADLEHNNLQHALCYIDLDQFKIVNDTCGHQAGDRLLCELTEALQKHLNNNQILARLGGDEFGVIICNTTLEQTERVASDVFSHFKTAMFEHEGNVFPVRCSMGVVAINKQLNDVESIMSAADIACYAAKSNGRNNFVTYSESDSSMSKHKEDMNWLPRLEKAIQNDGFRLLAQPIAKLDSTNSHNFNHYEFLIRLNDTDVETIAPMTFIRAAERFDLMKEIDRWVINNGMQLVSDYQHNLCENTVFSINLSGQSAADPALLEFICNRFEFYQLDPRAFWFEITETAAISHFDTAVALFNGLRELGCKVALDDFGSGVSSFAYLRKLPLDVLKIDGQLVRDVATSSSAKEIIRAIQHVATSMELATVAEFVEDESVVAVLQELTIDFAQGYGIGKPVEFDQILNPDSRNRAA